MTGAAAWIPLVALAITAQAETAAPAVLQPSSKWTVDYSDNACTAGRSFGEGPGKVTVGLRPSVVGGTTEVIVAATHGMPGPGFVKGRVEAQPGGALDIPFEVRTGAESALRIATAKAAAAELMGVLGDARQVTFSLAEHRFVVALNVPAALTATINSCQRELMQRFGIDPALAAAEKSPAVPKDNPGSWINASDYPGEARRKHASGVVKVLFRVTSEGQVADCRPLQGSGSGSLDGATCALITRRGRYQPARDAAGNAIDSWQTLQFHWTMGG